VTDSPTGPALSAAERQAAETLLTDAWGERTVVRAAEAIWDRSHVVRLHLGAGHLGADRSAVLKRRGEIDELGIMMNATGPVGLVHGDARPDNVRIASARLRKGRAPILPEVHARWT
jgi:hypothetical protein